jgi:hypothetical protein
MNFFTLKFLIFAVVRRVFPVFLSQFGRFKFRNPSNDQFFALLKTNKKQWEGLSQGKLN